MAFVDALPADEATKVLIRTAGDVFHTETSEEETIQNILRHYTVIEAERIAAGDSPEVLAAIGRLKQALVRVGDEGGGIVANYRDVIAEIKEQARG